MGIEQRRHQRRRVKEEDRFLFLYKLKEKFLAKKTVALTLNMSASGLLFRASELIPLNTLLKGVLEVPPLKRKFKVDAKVVRVEPTHRDGIYDIAVYFTQINNDDQEMLNAFCLGAKDDIVPLQEEITDNSTNS